MVQTSVTEHLTLTRQDIPAYDASDLTKGGYLAQIVYGDKTYTLRITRSGKLILTK